MKSRPGTALSPAEMETIIRRLERGQSVPGTVIKRVLASARGVLWAVGIGPLGMPKSWTYGRTIGAALRRQLRVAAADELRRGR